MPQISANSNNNKFWWFLLITIIAIVLYSIYPHKTAEKKTPTATSDRQGEMTVNALPLVAQNVMVKSSYIGHVTPIKSVNVMPNISGYLQDVFVLGGQEVKVGDKLLKIDPREYQAQLDAAKASVVQAQANFNNAKVYYERIQKAGVKAISKTEIDNAKAKYLSSEGALSQAKANQKLAQVNLDYTDINATIDGMVGNVDLTKGNYVSPASSPLLSIIQYNPIRVVFSITDKEYLDEMARKQSRLFEGEKIQLGLSNGKIYAHDGEFQFTDNSINRSTNSIAIYVDFANDDKTLVANAYVDVFLERMYQDKVLINKKYVTLNSSGSYIDVVQNNKLKKIALEILTSFDDSYVVANKFASDEYLVTDKLGRIEADTKFIVKLPSPTKQEKK